MTDKEYHEHCAVLFTALEEMLDATAADYDNNGSVLHIETDGGNTIIINKQPPKHEIWLAEKNGGRHFRYVDGDGASGAGSWQDTRDGASLTALFGELLG